MSGSETRQDVCAVIYGASQTASVAGETVAAVCAQTTLPARVLVAATTIEMSHTSPSQTPPVVPFEVARGTGGPLVAGVTAGAATGARWLWLLDGVTIPEPEALARLLDVTTPIEEGCAPVLAVSKVIDGSGHLHPDAIPRHEIFEKERSVQAAARHLVQLRAARHGSVLLNAAAVQRFGPPRSDLPDGLDMWEWSARMLRRWEDSGYLVPASLAIRRVNQTTAPKRRQWLARALLLGGDTWSPSEKLWEAFLLGEEVLASTKRRRPGRRLRGRPG